jgi:hypothetical protein
MRIHSEIKESACACVSTQKQWNRYALAFRNKGIGMRLRIHSETMESACACAQKQRNRQALAYPLRIKGIGMRLRIPSGNKENESDGKREDAGAIKVVFR